MLALDSPEAGQDIQVLAGQDYHGPIAFDAMMNELLAELPAFSDEDLGLTQDLAFFAEVSDAAARPDDTVLYDMIARKILEAKASGQVDRTLAMGAILVAMSCQHAHLDSLVSMAKGDRGKDDDHQHNDTAAQEEQASSHDKKTCKDCRAGKQCTRA